MAASSSSTSSSSSKHTSFNQKLFTITLLLIFFSIFFSFFLLVFSFKPELQLQNHHHPHNNNNNDHLLLKQRRPKWLDVIGKHIKGDRIRVGLVNLNKRDGENGSFIVRDHMHVEAVHVKFDPVGADKKWEDLFPEWIDEDHKWGPPTCPEMPVATPPEGYRDLDVIVAKVPCDNINGRLGGIRDVFRLQVNLVVANLAVDKKKPDDYDDRTVYVVFEGECGAMVEMFRCDDLVEHVGEYWIYKPDLRRLKQKVKMPVGSCQIAHTSTGEFLFVF